MDCDICQRAHHPKRLPFLCAVDARNRLYDGRIASARLLMEMADAESRVNQHLEDAKLPAQGTAKERCSRSYVENCVSEEHQTRARTQRIIDSADRLRDKIAASRREVQERRADMARRASRLSAPSPEKRERQLEETRRASKMTRYTWDREYEAMIQYRGALCCEVAKLYRLQKVRRGNPVRFEYKIGGIDIVDLHQMNNAAPEVISASLAHITHLLWLTSHYLAVRLPAEITLPHDDYPRPTIFHLQTSYQHGPIPFPGTTPLSPDLRDRASSHVPHPRPLFIDKNLHTLAREDSSAYSSFIEAVCLLAYDIAWLCRTQGVSANDNGAPNLDDFFCMGRNMYNLVTSTSFPQNPQPQFAPDHIVSPGNRSAKDQDISGRNLSLELGRTAPRMGLYSHGTAHTFLGSSAGTELTRSFRLPNPIKIADRLKTRLLHENPARDWELVENESNETENAIDEGVLVGGTAPPRLVPGDQAARFGLESYMSVNTGRGISDRGTTGSAAEERGVAAVGKERQRERGTNGWTKIKPR